MSSSTPAKPSQIPRACRTPVTPRQGGLRPSASQERLRHDNESLSVPKHRTSRSSPVKKKAPSPAQVPTRNAVCTGGISKVDHSVSTNKTPSKLPQPSPKPHPQDDIFKKPQIRPWSPQQEQRPNSPTKQFQTIHEESASDNQQLTSEHLASEFKDTPISRRSRPSLSERTIETISQIPPSPSPRRRKSSFYSTESPMRPPSRPASAMSNGIERMSNFGSSRRVSGLDSGLASSGEGNSSHKSSAQSSVYHTPARRSTSRTSSQSTSSSLKASLSAEGMTLTIPEFTSNHQRNPNPSETRATGLVIPRPSMQEIRANGRSLLPEDRKSEDEYTSPFQPEDFSNSSLGGSTLFSKAPVYSKPSKLTSQSSSHLDTQREATDDSSLNFPTTVLASRSSSRGKCARLEMSSEIFKSIPGQRSFSSSSGPFRGIIAAARAAWPIRNISWSDGGAPKQATTSDSQICLDNSYDSVWQLRLLESIKTAMKTGRMDISGLWLTQIPNPIARLYGVALVEDSGPFPNEEVDISNFIAATNRLKAIPDEAFPDTPAWKRVGRRGSCFHNLMFLDMHHNQLERLPMGLRRLESLAKLDLVRQV